MLLGAWGNISKFVANQLQESDVREGATCKGFQHCSGDECVCALSEVGRQRESNGYPNRAADDKDGQQNESQEEPGVSAHQSNAKGQPNDALVNGNTKKDLDSLHAGRWG